MENTIKAEPAYKSVIRSMAQRNGMTVTDSDIDKVYSAFGNKVPFSFILEMVGALKK